MGHESGNSYLERDWLAALDRAEAAERRVTELGEELTVAKVKIGCEEAKMMQAESQLAAAQERLRAMEWRPIAEYDAMAEKPFHRVFGRKVGKLGMAWDVMRHTEDTHFLQLPPIPEGE